MQYSKLMEIVWVVASREAIAAGWKEIQPGHFVMGILKLSEASPSDILTQQNVDKETLQEITSELDRINQFFKKKNIDTTMLRRKVRTKLGNGNEIYTGGVIHRSETCKLLFTKTEQHCVKEGKNSIDLLDLFDIFAKENMPGLLNKKTETQTHNVLYHFLAPLDMHADNYIKYPPETLNENHPFRLSLSKRISQNAKGILLFYQELNFLYHQLSIISDKLREESISNLNQVKAGKTLTEREYIELLEIYSNSDKTILVFPAIDSESAILVPANALNKFMEYSNAPPKIVLPVKIDLQQLWYTNCAKCKLFFYPLTCYDASFYKKLSVDKV
jgi:hypothetical protein